MGLVVKLRLIFCKASSIISDKLHLIEKDLLFPFFQKLSPFSFTGRSREETAKYACSPFFLLQCKTSTGLALKLKRFVGGARLPAQATPQLCSGEVGIWGTAKYAWN
jgi:hypothetical protein